MHPVGARRQRRVGQHRRAAGARTASAISGSAQATATGPMPASCARRMHVDDHGQPADVGQRLAGQAGGRHAGRDEDDGVQRRNSAAGWACLQTARRSLGMRPWACKRLNARVPAMVRDDGLGALMAAIPGWRWPSRRRQRPAEQPAFRHAEPVAEQTDNSQQPPQAQGLPPTRARRRSPTRCRSSPNRPRRRLARGREAAADAAGAVDPPVVPRRPRRRH